MSVRSVLARPEVGPDHQQHRHIPHPQPLLFPDEPVGAVDEEQETRPGHGPEEGAAEGQVVPEERVDEREDEARHRDRVGQDLVEIIDEPEGDEGAREEAAGEELQAQSPARPA